MSNSKIPFFKREQTRKILVFTGLGILFLGSMYLIFVPSQEAVEKEEALTGLNMNIPDATEGQLHQDKQKAYEFCDKEEVEEERMKAIGSLGDMHADATPIEEEQEITDNHIDRSMQEYQATTQEITSFYHNEYDVEKENMRQEIEELKQELEQMSMQKDEEQQQLELLEKSYQMASKYLPTGMTAQTTSQVPSTIPEDDDDPAFEVLPVKTNIVSALYQPMSDNVFIEEYSKERNMSFITSTAGGTTVQKNTIACRVDRTTTIKDNETLQLRLMETVKIGAVIVPKNALLTAKSKIAGNRMLLQVTTIEVGENIYPVKLTAYDMDGLEGVFIPGSDGMDALKEVGSNIGSSAGTSFTFAQSAKDQIISDAARGIMQGGSNYLVKKIRAIKVTFKSGHRLMLLPMK